MAIRGLPSSQPNPKFKLEKFRSFVPRFVEFVDSKTGVVSIITNSILSNIALDATVTTKIGFRNDTLPKDLKVLNIDSNKDIILGKDNSCYRSGYTVKSNIVLQNNEVTDVDVKIYYYIQNDELEKTAVKTYVQTLTASEDTVIEIEDIYALPHSDIIFTIEIENTTLANVILKTFDVEAKSNFVAANGDGYALYEAFCTISDNKILKNVWNSDWDFGMSLCIAHYLSLINRETQKSFGLEDVGKDTFAKGTPIEIGEVKHTFEYTMEDHRFAKFWNSTEYGRMLITLLGTKGFPTMFLSS